MHGTTHQRPIDRFVAEAAALVRTHTQPSFLQAMVRERVVAKDWLVAIDTNRYAVPCTLIGKTVQLVRVGGHWHLSHQGKLVAQQHLSEHMTRLRLFRSRERLEALLQEAAGQEFSHVDFLERVLTEEVSAKTSRNIAMRTAMTRFPFVKPLGAFDFAYQPSVDKKQVLELASSHFIKHGDNVIILGPPGVSKTHLSVALGMKAIEHGYRVLFVSAAHLISALAKALAENCLEEKFKVFTMPRLLIVDEIGYLPIDRSGANLSSS